MRKCPLLFKIKRQTNSLLAQFENISKKKFKKKTVWIGNYNESKKTSDGKKLKESQITVESEMTHSQLHAMMTIIIISSDKISRQMKAL